MKSKTLLLSVAAASALCWAPAGVHALPVITDVVETGGDNEATDTITAKWTGVTWDRTVANEPTAGAVGTPFTCPVFGEEVPAFVDRNHQWTGATPTLLIPRYLLGGEYIMSGNDNRDNPDYRLDVTINKKSFVYMLVDDRLGDASNANPPNFPDWTADRTGDGNPDMRWIVDEGWQPVKTGHNRHGNPDWPDHIGVDEGADGAGPGQGVNQWSSIYVKVFDPGTFTIAQPDNNGQNMYGAVVVPYPEKPIVTAARGNLLGFTFTMLDGALTKVKADTIAVTLEGAPVTVSVSKSGDVTTVRYQATPFFPSGSTHVAVLSFTDDGTPATAISETLNFTVETFATLTAEDAIPADSVDTASSGFLARVAQARDSALWPTLDLPNNTQRAENQLAGRLTDPVSGNALQNFATAGSGPRGTHPVALVNWNQEARPNGTQVQAGNFTAASTPAFPDEPIPGIPGTDPDSVDNIDNIAAEIVGYLELKAGLNRFGVNSDDGFRVTVGRDPRGAGARELGVFSGGRGSADSMFYVNVAQDGIYPVRLIWYEGGGGANLEFFSEDLTASPPVKILVNDRANPKGVKSYSLLRTPQPPTASVSPLPGASNVWPGLAIQAQITDQDTAVAVGSTRLLVNGQEVTTGVSKSGPVTTVRYQPAGLLPSGQTLQVELQYADTGNPATQVSQKWQFTVRDYSTLPVLQAGHAIPAGQINRGTSGFAVDVYQMVDSSGTVVPRPGNANTIATAETQLARGYNDPATGQPYANGAFPGALPDGRHEVEVINWNQTAPANAGAFTLGNDPLSANPNFTDLEIPGIPAGDSALQNWIVGEAVGFVELKAGIYRFGVNSDDGFKLIAGTTPQDLAAPVLGQFDAGRGSTADLPQSACDFVVQQDGIYPLRLLWFEGEGGANCELHNLEMEGNSSTLLNDRNRALHVKVYRQYTGPARPLLRSVTPAPGAAGVLRDAPIEAVIENYTGDVTLSVNGRAVTPEKSVAGSTTTVRYTPATKYPNNAPVEVVLGYAGISFKWMFFTINAPDVGPKIAWVSFHPADNTPATDAATAGFTTAPDVGYTQLLTANGYAVTRIVTSGTPDTALLNTFDLVIVSRSVPSGDYQDPPETLAWNTTLTAPTMVMGGYVLRNSRLGFTTGATIPDTAGAVTLKVNEPAHPIFEGVALGAGNVMVNPYASLATFNNTVQRGISVNTDPVAGNGKVLAVIGTEGDPAFGGMVIGEWEAGDVTANARANVLGGPRLVFLSGSREASGLTSQGAGIFDLTEDGTKLFLNAVKYMTTPQAEEPVLAIQRQGGNIVISWAPAGGTLETSSDLVNWTPVAGATSPATIAIGSGNAFYRVKQ
jgi:hypothetical protein